MKAQVPRNIPKILPDPDLDLTKSPDPALTALAWPTTLKGLTEPKAVHVKNQKICQ